MSTKKKTPIHRNVLIFASLVLSTYINILGKVNESLLKNRNILFQSF